MTENNVYIILTGALFKALNAKRKNNSLAEIENVLIASKLGILFTLRTHSYINFKGEQVALTDEQLNYLTDIFNQHFNVDMSTEILTLMIRQDKLREKQATNTSKGTPSTEVGHRGLLNKIKGILKIRPKVQENEA